MVWSTLLPNRKHSYFSDNKKVVQNCTILFSDVVGFTSTCSQLTPMEVVSLLNSMYTKFDQALENHYVYKVTN